MIVPLFPSHFSALGMLLADERHDFIRTCYGDLTGIDFGTLVKIHDEMVHEARSGAASLRRMPSAASSSICAMSVRSSRCRFR